MPALGEESAFTHTPGVGVVWDSVHGPRCLGHSLSYPLKSKKPHDVAANSGAVLLSSRGVFPCNIYRLGRTLVDERLVH